LTIIVVNLVAKFYAVAKISQIYCWDILIWATLYVENKKLSYRRETARELHTSFSAHSLIVHFTEHRICFTSI